jgi:hypothetical protein
MFEGQCVCECTDAPEYADHDGNLVNRFGNGTIQGAAAGIKLGDFKDQPDSYSTWNEHKTRNFTFGHLGSIKHQQIFKKSDKFWKPPSYYIGKAEIEAIRSCCSRNDIIHTADPAFPNCAELAAADDVMIKMHLAELSESVTNIRIKQWLAAKGCFASSASPVMTP